MQQRHAGERHGREDRQGEQVDERLGEHRARHDRQQAPVRAVEPAREHEHARGLADARRETRAEAITPIIVARTTAAQPIGVSGSAARSVSCQETERSSSEDAISTSASATQPGVAVIRAWPMWPRSRRDSAKPSSPARSSAATTRPTRRWTRDPRRVRGCFGVASSRRGSIKANLPLAWGVGAGGGSCCLERSSVGLCLELGKPT